MDSGTLKLIRELLSETAPSISAWVVEELLDYIDELKDANDLLRNRFEAMASDYNNLLIDYDDIGTELQDAISQISLLDTYIDSADYYPFSEPDHDNKA